MALSDARREWLCRSVAFVAPILALLFAEAVQPRAHFRYDDNVAQQAPLVAAACEVVLSGAAPLWTPDTLCGAPLVPGLMTGALYPPNLPLYLLAGRDPVRLMVTWPLFHVGLAGLTMFLLARTLGRSRAASLLGAATLALGAPLLFPARSWAMYSLPFAWAPAALACAVLAARGRTAGVIGGAMCVAMCVAAGDGEAALFACLLALLLGAAVTAEEGLGRGALARVVGLCALGAALSLPVVLPVVAELAASTRTDVIRGGGQAPLAALSSVFFPGTPAPSPYAGVVVTSWFYVGLAPTLLALHALWRRPLRPTRALWLATALLGTWLSLGSALGADEVVARLPLLHVFHHPLFRLRLVGLALAALAADGFDLLAATPAAEVRRLCWRGAAAIALTAFPAAGHLLGAAAAQVAFVAASLLGLAACPAARRAALVAAITAAGQLTYLTRYWEGPSPYLPHTTGRAPDPRFTKDRRWVVMTEGELQRLPADALAGRSWGAALRVPSVGGYPVFTREEHVRLFDMLQKGQVADPARALRILRTSFPAAAGVRYVAVSRLVSPALLPSHRLVAEEAHVVPGEGGELPHLLLEDPRYVGRAYFVDGARPVARFDPAALDPAHDLLRETFYEGSGPAERFARGEVLALRETPGRIQVDVRTGAGDGLLVVAVTHDDGWRAEVDGAPARIREVLGYFLAVEVPAGARAVTLRYRDRELELGLLAALVALGVALAWAVKRRRAL